MYSTFKPVPTSRALFRLPKFSHSGERVLSARRNKGLLNALCFETKRFSKVYTMVLVSSCRHSRSPRDDTSSPWKPITRVHPVYYLGERAI